MARFPYRLPAIYSSKYYYIIISDEKTSFLWYNHPMRRKLTAQLQHWRASGTPKPLVLYGARQVGKSYAVTDFAQTHYRRHLIINFETNRDYQQAFAGSLQPASIINW